MKTLTVYRPNAIQNAMSDFDHYFESFFGDSFLAPHTRMFNHIPAVDIQETDNSYVLDMELPGYDEKDIEINVDGSNLTISSKEEDTLDEKKSDGSARTYILRERSSSSFTRSFKLPENSDPETVNAAFKNGILNLQIKKRAEAQKRTIQINAA
jgi:HSP20 family protein